MNSYREIHIAYFTKEYNIYSIMDVNDLQARMDRLLAGDVIDDVPDEPSGNYVRMPQPVHQPDDLEERLAYIILLNQLDEARTALEGAIVLCDKLFPAGAGAFRGSLAVVLARKGDIEESFHLLSIGEQQVKVYPMEHGKFLCKKGLVQLWAGQPKKAFKTLQQAQQVATQNHVEEGSELAKMLMELQSLLQS